MNSPTRARAHQSSPRDFEEAALRGKQDARFDSHDDFYAFLDSNRGGLNGPYPQPSAQQPRSMPTGQPSPPADQSRPPVTNTFPAQRSGSGSGNGNGNVRSRPPSYSGSRSEELLVAKGENRDYHNKVQRQNGRRNNNNNNPRPTTSGGPAINDAPPRSAGGSGSPRRAPAPATTAATAERPRSSDSLAATAGAGIQRLKSPGIMSSVLQPLDQKVHEYGDLMDAEQDEMTRLDDELRALQQQRAQAEARFLDAKAKHDDYRRQYQDVERAMRGEMPLAREPQRPVHHQPNAQHQQQQQQQPVHFRDEDDDDDDDYDEPLPTPNQRRVQSQQSFGRSSQKMGMKERFRASFFGGR